MRKTIVSHLAVVLTVIGLIAAVASPASAMNQERVVIDASFDENVCGIDVHTTVTGHVILHIQDIVIEGDDEDDNSFWIGVINEHLDITYTNAAGVSLTNTVRDNIQEGDLVDIGAGYWLYTYTINGQPVRLKSGNQTVMMDMGQISFEDVIYFGDLETFADDQFISSTVTSISGPHPDAESDFALFCEVFTDILG